MPRFQTDSPPQLPISSSALDETLTNRLHWAIEQRLVEQELITPDGARLRFGVRKTDRGEEFFAENANTGEPLSLNRQQPRQTKSGLIIKLNELRKLRPAAPLLKPGRLPDLDFTPSTCKFGCVDPTARGSILNRAILLRVKARAYEFAIMPQLAPLEPAHVLLVPCEGTESTTFPHLDQLVDPGLINDILDLARGLREWIMIFNSMHAGATVRHLHLQALKFSEPLPVKGASTIERSGCRLLDNFPARGMVFDQAERSKLIQTALALQSRWVPFNLLAHGQKVFLSARNPEQEIIDLFPFTRFAAMEMAGVIYVSNQEAFDAATNDTITAALRRTTLTPEQLLKVLPS